MREAAKSAAFLFHDQYEYKNENTHGFTKFFSKDLKHNRTGKPPFYFAKFLCPFPTQNVHDDAPASNPELRVESEPDE